MTRTGSDGPERRRLDLSLCRGLPCGCGHPSSCPVTAIGIAPAYAGRMSGRQDNQGRHEHRGFARYGRYLGGPDPLAPPVDIADALADIGREVMEGTSLRRALQEYLRRGGRDRGLDDLARQVARKRSELLRRHKLDGTLSEIRELLDRAVLAERKQLARDLDDDARFAEMQLENLPSRTSEAVNELRDYQWRSPEARQAYQQIADLMGREALDQRFAGMKQALQNATEADRQAVNEMLADLNQLLEAHARGGEDTDQQFADFMAKHGEFFPENPQTIDELLDALAQRAAAARRMRNSLTPRTARGTGRADRAGLRLPRTEPGAVPAGQQPDEPPPGPGLVGRGGLRG